MCFFIQYANTNSAVGPSLCKYALNGTIVDAVGPMFNKLGNIEQSKYRERFQVLMQFFFIFATTDIYSTLYIYAGVSK